MINPVYQKPEVKGEFVAITTTPVDQMNMVKTHQTQSQFEELSIKQGYYISPTPTLTPLFPPVSLIHPNVGEGNMRRGMVKQIDSHTWTVSVDQDQQMSSAKEIFQALNTYRYARGRTHLQWNDSLATFAQERASLFKQVRTLDGHAGFMQYVNQEDGFHKLGYGALGENSSIGYIVTGTHLIELVYAADSLHDNNQLDSRWRDVGIGVDGSATDLVFGGKKL